MDKVLEILEEIKNTSSRKEKESILKKNKDNELLKEVLYFVFNDFIVTGISKKKLKKKVSIREFNQINNLMEYLKENNTGKDIDIVSIQTYIKQQPEHLQELYEKIATKDLKIGITAKTVNKMFGKGFIPEFGCMLAKKYQDNEHKVKGDFVISQKLDGSRLIIIKENGDVKSFTRTGKPYIGLNEIEGEIKNLPIDNIVFDGELIADTEGSSNEVFTETIKKSRTKDENKTGLLFSVFDMLPVEEFKQGKSSKCAIDRKKDLSALFNQYEFKYCKEVDSLYTGDDKSKIQEWLYYALDKGWEGIMVNLDKPYVCKRSDTLLKVKVMQTCDLVIEGFNEGEGKYKGTLGALTLNYKGYALFCGSGFTEEMRDEIWNNQDKYLGRIVEIQYFEEIETNSELSLRFPIFKSIRTDKNEPSYY